MSDRWRAARKLLVVRLDNLGDVLMTTPAFNTLKSAARGMSLTLLGSPAGVATLPHVPALDDAIAFDAPWMKGAGPGPNGIDDTAGIAGEHALIEQLRARRFDAAIFFTVSTQSALPAALLCRLAGIPLRLAHSRENPYRLLTDWVPDFDVCTTGMRHEVTRQLELVRSVGFDASRAPSTALQFETRADDVHSARRKLAAACGDPARPYLLVHPGASAPSRRWPAERFGMAADAAAQRAGCQVVVCGGPGELELVQAVRDAMRRPSIAMTGALTLGELAALIAGADALLCNNSGPAHLAAALGTPVAVLYALTNPQHTPWQAQARVLSHDVPCRHCLKSVCPQPHHGCLLGVPAEAAAQAVLALMGGARVTSPHEPMTPEPTATERAPA